MTDKEIIKQDIKEINQEIRKLSSRLAYLEGCLMSLFQYLEQMEKEKKK